MNLTMNNPPHIRSKDSITTIMGDVIISLIPLYFMAYYFYGTRAVVLGLIGIGTCMLADIICVKIAGRRLGLGDLSPIITGMIIPLFMPATIPFKTLMVACIFAIVIAKQPFGGLGQNIFNPAAAGLAFATICYPAQMFSYSIPLDKLPMTATVAVKTITSPAYSLLLDGVPKLDFVDMLLGNYAGPMGATNILVLVTCLLFLIVRKTASIKMTGIFLASIAAISVLFPRANMSGLESVMFELMSGSVLLGAIFLLNDPVTSPKRESSKLFYGVAAAIVVMLFRHFSGFEETTVFAILFINAFVWIIDINNEKIHSRLRRRRVEIKKAKKIPR